MNKKKKIYVCVIKIWFVAERKITAISRGCQTQTFEKDYFSYRLYCVLYISVLGWFEYQLVSFVPRAGQ